MTFATLQQFLLKWHPEISSVPCVNTWSHFTSKKSKGLVRLTGTQASENES